VAERLLHHDAPPVAGDGVIDVVGHPGALHLPEHHREGVRRDGEVEGGIAVHAM
jgi:hypothetical protein